MPFGQPRTHPADGKLARCWKGKLCRSLVSLCLVALSRILADVFLWAFVTRIFSELFFLRYIMQGGPSGQAASAELTYGCSSRPLIQKKKVEETSFE